MGPPFLDSRYVRLSWMIPDDTVTVIDDTLDRGDPRERALCVVRIPLHVHRLERRRDRVRRERLVLVRAVLTRVRGVFDRRIASVRIVCIGGVRAVVFAPRGRRVVLVKSSVRMAWGYGLYGFGVGQYR